MKLLSWNVNFRPPVDRTGDRAAKIKSIEPDIVTLQEVKLEFADEWVDELEKIRLPYHYLSGEYVPTASYQCLIASHWELTPDNFRWRSEAPYPELLGRATV